MARIPTFGLIMSVFIIIGAVYITSIIDNEWIRFGILFIAFFFVASAFMGLSWEKRIAEQIIQEGYVAEYVQEYGVGNRKTFTAFVETLKRKGFKMNPGVEKRLWEEIKKETGYKGYQNSV
ncbi:MAG: hypothetical protein HXS41_07040 [Theionarchaea archaeon]|nr:hypothetical protein [Theionarchaea archaeon]MBU7020798.1 hypothetical protein [Theionarchaea archaeon]MBU7034806.1 hypothetical protein [Theionarchaea archaeon]MBU7040281.1 hypothetical protein [Theionarchaea archaeon]